MLRGAGRLAGGYEWERDFPQSLQESDPNGRSSMDFDFSLTEDEIDEFQGAVGSRLNGNLPIRVQFGGGRPQFSVRKQRHSRVLSAKRDEIAEFVAERVQLQYIPAVRSADVSANIVRTMLRRELAVAEEQAEYRAAMEQLRRLQKPILDRIAASLSERMQELLPDVSRIAIEMDERRSPLAFGDVHVIVDDGTPTDLEFKGDGVQSLAALSIIQHYSSTTARAKEFILAVEEPESHLHPKAIHALRSVLSETASQQQVVLTTHSPLFINRLQISSNIIVERTRARPASSVQELRDLLGVRTSDNLEHAEVVLIVEGPEDELALRALLAERSDALRQALADGTLTIRPLFGGGKLTYVLAELRDSLASVHAFLDHDATGQAAAETAAQEGLLDMTDRTFALLPGAPRETEFEDLVDPAVYAETFQDRFGISVTSPWMTRLGKGKWSQRLPVVVKSSGQSWSDNDLSQYKSAVAQAVATSPGGALKPAAASVIDALVTALESKLHTRSL